MLVLILGLLLFLLPHLLRELQLRQRLLQAAPSKGAYMGGYALIVFTGLLLIIWGKSMAPFVMVWEPPFAERYVSAILMIPACILFVAGNLPMSCIRWQLRNPMLLGVFIWGLAHLWSNGDLASMLLFSSFTLWAAIKFVSLWREKESTATFELGWLARDGGAILGGALLYLILYVSHGQLFGIGLPIA